MSKISYYVRLALYVGIAAIPVISSGLSAGDVSGVKLGVMLLNTILAGMVAARAFIDKSPSQFHEAEKDNSQ